MSKSSLHKFPDERLLDGLDLLRVSEVGEGRNNEELVSIESDRGVATTTNINKDEDNKMQVSRLVG